MTRRANQACRAQSVSRRSVLAASAMVLFARDGNSTSPRAGSPAGPVPFCETTPATGPESASDAAAANPCPTEGTPEERVAEAPFGPPRNLDRFNPRIYTDGSPIADLEPRASTEAEIRSALRTALSARYADRSDGERLVEASMALFDDPRLVAVVPDHRLRAGVVNLRGTVGEPAIDAYLGRYPNYPRIRRVRFDRLVPRNTIAWVVVVPRGGIVVEFNPAFRYEDFRLLTPLLAHEPLHHDDGGRITEREEVIADTVETLVYAQLLLTDPTLGTADSRLARLSNTDLLGLLNSRDDAGRMTVRGGAGPLFPGGWSEQVGFGDLMDECRGTDSDDTDWQVQPATPGNPLLAAYVSKITGRRTPPLRFDSRVVDLLDEHVHEVLPPADQLSLFERLTVCPGSLTSDRAAPTTVTEADGTLASDPDGGAARETGGTPTASDDDETTSTGFPGFGVVESLAALAVALLGVRRYRRDGE